jgi:streptogramin lyase
MEEIGMKPNTHSIRTFIWMAGVLVWILCANESHSANPAALSGVVSSKEEGHMEGVLVSAKKEGANISVTVVSDSQGRYAFSSERLSPGDYRLRIRAVGYELDDPGIVKLEANKSARLELTLHKAKDLASQLSSAEWLMSAPGTPDQKLFGGFCIQCHTLEQVFRSKFDTAGFLPVLERMVNYSPSSMVEPQRDVFKVIPYPWEKRILRPESHVGGAITMSAKELAEYLSSINLSSSKGGNWAYEIKTLPRPKGRETKVIVTEYDLPRPRDVQPHDCVVDSHGIVWYNDIGGGHLGRLNPKTGEIKEWTTPILKPGLPDGSRDIELDKDGNVWLGMLHQEAIARFDTKTEKFTTWNFPSEGIPTTGAGNVLLTINPDGTVWFKTSSSLKAYKLDPRTGKVVSYETSNNTYGSATNSQGNLYLLNLNVHTMGELDAKTGKLAVYPVPTPRSGPRRGRTDSQDRLWYGAYYTGKVGMFDTKTKQFKEWDIPPAPYSGCYYAMIDHKGEVWCGSELTDSAYRLDTATGQVTSYLLPTLEANIQRIDVDNSTTPVALWVGEAHQAKLARIEPLD